MAVIRKRSSLEARKGRTLPVWAKRAIAWGPMTLAGLLLAGSGLVLLDASTGVEDSVAEAKALVAQQEQKADDAEAQLRAAREAVIEEALDTVSLKRELSDTQTARTLVEEALAGRGDKDVVEQAKSLKGSLEDFDAVLMEVDGSTYSWAATFSTDAGGNGLLTWRTSSDGNVSAAKIVVSQHDPRESDPQGD